MGNPTASLTLEEFLASNCLSRADLLLDHEDADAGLPPPQGDDGKERLRLRSLNAAKVSLVLIKAIASDLSNKTLTLADVACLQTDNYRIKLKGYQARLEKNEPVLVGQDAKVALQECSDGEQWIVDDVEVTKKGGKTAEIKNDDGTDDEQFPIVYAARMIHAIFSNGNATSSFLSPVESARVSVCETDGEDITVEGLRNSRTRRRDDTSPFDALLETGELPVSVCRLLSSMMNESDDHPITSLEGVIQDLDQMANNPQIFLYDQSMDFYSCSLHLGQGHYGRVEELTTLLDIATRSVGELAAVVGEGESRSSTPSIGNGVDAVLVSGAAGSGKSYFVQFARNHLSNMGWMVLMARFKRGLEYESREILLSLFGEMIGNLVSMRDGESEADIEYSRRASRAISDELDRDSLSSLANLLPIILELLPEIDNHYLVIVDAEMSHWQLVFVLAKLIGAILSLDRRLMICLDDLQWCDATTIGLISEIFIAASQCQESMRQRLFVVGMYRDDEVTESHPLADQLDALQKSSFVEVTEIKLPSLSKDDVADMIMSEARLPRRLVLGLAAAVHKKTSGHAMFVVELLNSLVRDSVIAYSPRKHRFAWDEIKIANLRTGAGVAGLLVSNLSSLEPKALRSLRILSCLGMQSDQGLIGLLDRAPISPQGDVESSLQGLADRGFLEMSGSLVRFAHDLLQQNVYESIPTDERLQLHLDIGLAVGSETTLDSTCRRSSIEGGVEEMYLSDSTARPSPSLKSSTLVATATDQINSASPQFIRDRAQRTRFAGWNLIAGRMSAKCSNFQAALHSYKCGIAFLADEQWLGDATHELCRELHEGAAYAAFALANATEVAFYAQAIIEHAPIEDSLVAQDLHIRSLKNAGKYTETIARGLALLRQLKIDVPSAPSPMTVLQAMGEVGEISSQYTPDQIINMTKQASKSARKRLILKVVDAVIVACYREASPYLPLVACTCIKYSLQTGVCTESASAFIVYGYFQVFLAENFEAAKRWGDIAKNIVDSKSTFAQMTLYGFLLFWFMPHREVAGILRDTYEAGMRVGDVDNATYALALSLRFAFFGAENLSLLSRQYRKALELMVKYNQECLKIAVVDSLLVDGLTGIDNCPFLLFDGKIQNEDILLAEAKYMKNPQGIEVVYTQRFFSAFWRGDYAEAKKWTALASSLPSSKMPKVQNIHRTFYSGLMSYQMYRDGEGEEWLEEGKRSLEKMQSWEANCKDVFSSKLILLEAEDFASSCNMVAAKESYELAAKTAREHGLKQEEGLFCESFGKFLASIVDRDALVWFQKAYTCYMEWGATAKAEQLRKDHNFSLPDESTSLGFGAMKHRRDEDGEDGEQLL